MPPELLMLLGQSAGGGLPIIGSIVGALMSAPDRESAERYLRQAAEQYNIPLPQLQQLVAEELGRSQIETAQVDPSVLAAQRGALAQLQRVGREGAGGVEFRGAVQMAEQESNRQDAARRAAILREMQARGGAGSGMELAARMQSAQDAANRSAGMGFGAAMAGRQQALQAMQAAGGMAGGMRGQEWQERSARARAADEIARFNLLNRQQMALRNAGLPQQQFENQMRLAGGRAGALGQLGGFYGGRAGQTQQMWTGIGQGAGYGAASATQSYDDWLRRQQQGGP